MQTETIDKSQQATPSIDEELIDTLIAILKKPLCSV